MTWKNWQLTALTTALLWGMMLLPAAPAQDDVVQAGLWGSIKKEAKQKWNAADNAVSNGVGWVDDNVFQPIEKVIYGDCTKSGQYTDAYYRGTCEKGLWQRAEDVATATGNIVAGTVNGAVQGGASAITGQPPPTQTKTQAALCAEIGAIVDPQNPQQCVFSDMNSLCAYEGKKWNGVRCQAPGETDTTTRQLDCRAGGYYWDSRLQDCYQDADVATSEYCASQGQYHLGGSTCGTLQEAVCTQTPGAYYAKQWDTCYESRTAYNIEACQAQGKYWFDGCITYEQYQARQEELDCKSSNLYWRDGKCYASEEDYEQIQCQEQGLYYYKGDCIEEGEFLKQSCGDTGHIWIAELYPGEEYPCFETMEAYHEWTCAQDGLVYFREACMELEEVRGILCHEEGGAYVSERGCFHAVDVYHLCTDQGHIFDATQDACLVTGSQGIPQGLEKFYLTVTDAQYNVLAGDYRFWLNNQLAGLSKDYVKADEYSVTEILDLVEAARQAIQARTLQDLSDASSDYVPDQEAYQTLLQQEKRILVELDEVERILLERERTSSYHATPPPGSSIQLLERTIKGSWPEITISYPVGFPTPERIDDRFVGHVPVRVTAPTVRHPFLDVTIDVYALYYELSLDGGRNWIEDSIDVEAGQRDYEIQFQWPASSGRTELAFRARALFSETFVYRESDIVYEIDGVRAGTMMKRSFYTSSSPFQAATAPPSDSVESTAYTASEAPSQDGEQPGGMASAYNAAAYYHAKATATAKQADQERGLGLALLLDALPYLLGAVILYTLYAKEYLNWIPGIKNFQERRKGRRTAMEDPLSLDLGDDLLEGIL